MTTRRKGGQRRGFANAEKALQTARNARRKARFNSFMGVLDSVQGRRPGPIASNNTGPRTNTRTGLLQFFGQENLARLSWVDRGFRNMVKQTFHFQTFTLNPGQSLVQLYRSFPGALNIDLTQRRDIKDQEFLDAMPLGFKNVRILNMESCYKITDAGLAPLTNLTSLNIDYCDQITPAAFTTLDKLEICRTFHCTTVVQEAAKAKIAENMAHATVSNMEALDGGTRRRRYKKHKQSKKTRRL